MNFNIPQVTKNLLIVNVLAFVAAWILEAQGTDLNYYGGLHFFMADDFHIYQLVTYQFLHGSLEHIFWNMFALWMFGVVMERVWGPKKFLFYYIFCGIGAGVIQELVQWGTMTMFPDMQMEVRLVNGTTAMIPYTQYLLHVANMVGASGAIYAILLAFGMTFPNERIMLLIPPIPMKAKWFVIIYAAIELLLAINSTGDGVAHVAHLGGMLFGFCMIRYWRNHPNAHFNQNSGRSFFENMKRNYEQRQQQHTRMKAERGGNAKPRNKPESDMEYNERKKKQQEVIDRILDKIRKSGYDSLTKEEKQTLFEASRER